MPPSPLRSPRLRLALAFAVAVPMAACELLPKSTDNLKAVQQRLVGQPVGDFFARAGQPKTRLPKMDGANLKVHAVEVTYPPGATSSAHRHPCPVVGYMVSGTMRMQVSDGPLTDYTAGETFVEMPTDVHRVATNPSRDTPAVFLVTFVCDKETPLSVPEPAPAK